MPTQVHDIWPLPTARVGDPERALILLKDGAKKNTELCESLFNFEAGAAMTEVADNVVARHADDLIGDGSMKHASRALTDMVDGCDLGAIAGVLGTIGA